MGALIRNSYMVEFGRMQPCVEACSNKSNCMIVTNIYTSRYN